MLGLPRSDGRSLAQGAHPCRQGQGQRCGRQSESEEAKFELTMPDEGVPCALAKHLESGEAFALRYLGK